jgi:predicted small metal-binding protein
MKSLHCADLGSSCDFVARAETEDDLMRQVADHAKNVHGMNEIAPEMKEKVKGAIRDEQRV